MSFSPDSVKHLLQTVPAEHICQLVDDIDVDEIREELGLGALTGGAVANVMKAAQLEGERILDDCEVGLAGPGIDYVREHARTRSALAGIRPPVPGMDRGFRDGTWRCARDWASTKSPPTSPPGSWRSSIGSQQVQLPPGLRGIPARLMRRTRGVCLTRGRAAVIEWSHAISLVRPGHPDPLRSSPERAAADQRHEALPRARFFRPGGPGLPLPRRAGIPSRGSRPRDPDGARPLAVMTREEWIALSGLLEAGAAVGLLIPATRRARPPAASRPCSPYSWPATWTPSAAPTARTARRSSAKRTHPRFPLQVPLILWAWSLRNAAGRRRP